MDSEDLKIIKNLPSYIDHTFLKKNASAEDIKRICGEAVKYNFKTVCIFKEYLEIASKLLKNKNPIPITVIDFPMGISSPYEKAKETKDAIKKGAKEIDVVIDYKSLIGKNYKLVFDGIKAVVDTAEEILVKVIIETSELTDYEKIIACALSKAANAAFVKTSTGLSKTGATKEDVALMEEIIGDNMHVKASGGIKTLSDALIMIKAGAERIGTSSSCKIMDEVFKLQKF